ncbi:hypothetical protein M5K25_011205 [Dendrobium thyrsiflorum]|uniref:SWIRM domain-containing protein n=1 Tax=Dendrobium thyrsiflorum TaxID=117978 RepID=A0ABD0V2U1_DENTH
MEAQPPSVQSASSSPSPVPATENPAQPSQLSQTPAASPVKSEIPARESNESLPAAASCLPDTPPRVSYTITIPSCSGWFSWDQIHETEKRILPEFFDERSSSKNPSVYKYYRDSIIGRFRANPSRKITFTEARRGLVGDVGSVRRVFDFLEAWGLINYTPSVKPLPKEKKEAGDTTERKDSSKRLCSNCKSLCNIVCFVTDKEMLIDRDIYTGLFSRSPHLPAYNSELPMSHNPTDWVITLRLCHNNGNSLNQIVEGLSYGNQDRSHRRRVTVSLDNWIESLLSQEAYIIQSTHAQDPFDIGFQSTKPSSVRIFEPELATKSQFVSIRGVSEEISLVAFIATWLCGFVFLSQDRIFRRGTLLMASLITSGRQLSLAPAVLAQIYHGFRHIIASYGRRQRSIDIPWHYIQGWVHIHVAVGDLPPLRFGVSFVDSFTKRGRPTLISRSGYAPIASNFVSMRLGWLYYRRDSSVVLEGYDPNRAAQQFSFVQATPLDGLSALPGVTDHHHLSSLLFSACLEWQYFSTLTWAHTDFSPRHIPVELSGSPILEPFGLDTPLGPHEFPPSDAGGRFSSELQPRGFTPILSACDTTSSPTLGSGSSTHLPSSSDMDIGDHSSTECPPVATTTSGDIGNLFSFCTETSLLLDFAAACDLRDNALQTWEFLCRTIAFGLL